MGGWDLVGDSLMRALTYLFIMVSSLGAMTLIAAAAPGFLLRQRQAAKRGMRRCFLWGLIFTINCVLIAALLRLMDGVIAHVIALAILVALLVVALSGLAAVSCEVGRRVMALGHRYEWSDLGCIIVGTIVLFVTAVIPVLGWLLFAGALLTGIGAFLDSATQDWRPSKKQAHDCATQAHISTPN